MPRRCRDTDSLGKNLVAQRAAVLVLGGALAGLSGAILVGFINTWSPAAWGYAETIVLVAAVIIGGSGSHLEPAVFLLDEPTANLAPKVATELLTGHVRALAEAGAGVLIVEQRPGPCSPSPTTPTCWAAARF